MALMEMEEATVEGGGGGGEGSVERKDVVSVIWGKDGGLVSLRWKVEGCW